MITGIQASDVNREEWTNLTFFDSLQSEESQRKYKNFQNKDGCNMLDANNTIRHVSLCDCHFMSDNKEIDSMNPVNW